MLTLVATTCWAFSSMMYKSAEWSNVTKAFLSKAWTFFNSSVSTLRTPEQCHDTVTVKNILPLPSRFLKKKFSQQTRILLAKFYTLYICLHLCQTMKFYLIISKLYSYAVSCVTTLGIFTLHFVSVTLLQHQRYMSPVFSIRVSMTIKHRGNSSLL